ncbi:N-acetylglucosamine-6-phosphate deacetylase [Salsuginibacillus kocurii]|uniref:N-acetylglucosamine-6-phosphate deacetylase n=1 Tax=Salsuginibacillus kocurii TaxID=427078 RepID=UPI000379CC4F|nr:N-acetylglucosamine-6-phosphate deacetylase [Salsuginibacillus kocurii]
MEKNSIVIEGTTIINPEETIENASIYIKEGIIQEITQTSLAKENYNCRHMKAPENSYLIPGMIDLHIHGAVGADVMDASPEQLKKLCAALPEEGTTSFLPTTLTESPSLTKQALSYAAAHYKQQGIKEAQILGIHLEGPFIHPNKKGAQPEEHIQLPSISQFEEFQQAADGEIKLVTLAPERERDDLLTSYLAQNNIIASIGHSDATYQETLLAMEEGVSHVTHLYNGMSGLHHRAPGVAAAALAEDNLTVEIIADGVHVHPDMVNLTFQAKGKERMMIITDSIRAKRMGAGPHELGGQKVFMKHGSPYLEDGTLAGSSLPMIEGFKNVLAYTNCSLNEAVQMTSYNQACKLGIEHKKGHIAAGKDADLVLLTEQLDVEKTFIQGAAVFES